MIKKLFLACTFAVFSFHAFSQGCSDAGFCSLGALKNTYVSNPTKNIIDIGFNFGYGEQKTLTYNSYFEYGVDLNEHFTLQGKLTATYASGFLGNTFNVGDIYGTVTYTPDKDAVNSVRFIAGLKVPLTTANDKSASGLPLPMDYQSSLGTYDIIGGINYIYKKHVELDAGIQLPVIQANHNTYFQDEYTDVRIKYFPSTNQFDRKPDVLLRLGYYINLPYSFSVKPNLLAIYRLANDSYISRQGLRSVLTGTSGLTLNEGVTVTKQFKNHNRLEAIIAAPLISKKVDDGLIREWVLNLQYSIAF